MQNSAKTPIKAVVKSVTSQVFSKSNGAEYVLCNCELIEGKGIGLVVPAQRTILTPTKESKPTPNIGDEVVVYHSAVPSKEDPTKLTHFFDIGMRAGTASQDELRAIFG